MSGSQPTFTVSPRSRLRADIYSVATGAEQPSASNLARALPKALASAVEQAASDPLLKGRLAKELESSAGTAGQRLLFSRLEQEDWDAVATWLKRSVDFAIKRGAKKLALILPDLESTQDRAVVARVARVASVAAYSFGKYLPDEKSSGQRKNQRRKSRLEQIVIVPPQGRERKAKAEAGAANALADGIRLTRDLANTPANVATPAWMASQARRLAKRRGLKVDVLGPVELKRRGMGGILAVGQGSKNSPRLVRLRYGDEGPAVALVGKGVTFDTGGISIKPSSGMEEMKYDKCGACTVLGVVDAVATLGLPVRLDAYVPLAENMPSHVAYRPSDIVTCYNGKTVEIINTDAEGRMILADALSWAAESSPDHIVEMSTLTGAVVVALGAHGAACFSPSDALASSLLEAAGQQGERLWRLPIWPEHLADMRGNHAELRNSGPRWGGASSAAAFLSQFVGDHESWAHLDIAGTAYSTKPVSSGQTGATGYGVATVVDWLRGL